MSREPFSLAIKKPSPVIRKKTILSYQICRKKKKIQALNFFVLNESYETSLLPFIGEAHLYSNTLPLKCAFVKVNTAHGKQLHAYEFSYICC